MRYAEFDDGDAFLAHAGALLERDEAVAGPLLGLAGMTETRFLAAVDDDAGRPCLAAGRLPDRKLVVHGAPEAVGVLAARLVADRHDLPSVIGEVDVACAFAKVWAASTGRTTTKFMGFGVYELREIEHDGDASGRLRVAGDGDVELLADWAFRFTRDAGVDRDQDRDSLRASVVTKIARQRLFLWEDEGPVSSAGLARPTRHGITVNSVFTPDEHRGRGYATACVAAVSRRMLEDGRDFCTLLTDLANPTSNAIYQRIGYRPVGELAEYDFHDAR